MGEKPLYQDNFFKVEYHPTSIDDHILSINDKKHGWQKYLLQRGILEELAKTPVVEAAHKIRTINELILITLESGPISEDVGVNFFRMHTALCQAYATEENTRKEKMTKEHI